MLRDQAPNSELQGQREPLDLEGQLLGKLPSAPLAMQLYPSLQACKHLPPH